MVEVVKTIVGNVMDELISKTVENDRGKGKTGHTGRLRLRYMHYHV